MGWAQVLTRHLVDPPTLAKGLAVIERNALVQKQTLEDLLDSRVAPTIGTPPPRVSDEVDSPKLDGLSVLVVDDHRDSLELAGQILSDAGAIVQLAESAAEALECVKRHSPDLIVSDIEMAGEDGYDFIRRVRLLPESAGGRRPAIALTAGARSVDRQRALRAGYQMHLTKPVDKGDLLTVCASLTGRLR
jgi:CheY-like chemotaxis protein